MKTINVWLRRPQGWVALITLVLLLLLLAIWLGSDLLSGTELTVLDADVRLLINDRDLKPLDPGPAAPAELVSLGQVLFFDKELSGNRDIACATCHHPQEGSGDSLAVSIGTGGAGLGIMRQIGYGRNFIPRNAPEVFNRGASEWHTMFWDSRVAVVDGVLLTPAGDALPPGLDNVLAAQAMFPVTSDDEMRGAPGDVDVYGNVNEIALIDGTDLPAIWRALMVRLLASPDYVALFQAAYPDVDTANLTFAHAANAMAAFEMTAYTSAAAPWDLYLAGDSAALSEAAKAGVLLFYGKANCAACHSGSLFTDQQHHSIALPQVGPGKGSEAPNDHGRYRETGAESDMYAFRTPPLRNVALTGPWGHDGAYSTLEAIVVHHLNPAEALRNYDPTLHLPEALQDTVQNHPVMLTRQLDYLDPLLAEPIVLSETELDNLMAFLSALTDPAALDMTAWVPATVPSGLPVAD